MNKIFAKLSILMLIITAIFGAGSRVSAEEQEKVPPETVEVSQEAAEQTALDELTKNQAASRDYMLLMHYLEGEASETLYNSFSGAYIDDSNELIIKLVDFNGQEELMGLAWETAVVFGNGKTSYFSDMKYLEEISKKLTVVNKAVLSKSGNSDYEELMGFFPCTNYNSIDGIIEVRLVASNHRDFDKAVLAFKEVIGDYSNVEYKVAKMEENTLQPASFPVNPGSGIKITGAGDYSLGFRAYYDYDGETNYGLVTCAHGNSVGQLVTLYPAFSGSMQQIGIIDRRAYWTSVDAAFVKITNGNAIITQNVQYSTIPGSSGGTVYQPAVLNGTYYTPAVGTVFYKSGMSTQLTKGKVVSNNESRYNEIDGLWHYGLILSNGSLETPQMVQEGDSGGVAFAITSGTSAKCVGIALGYSTWEYLFLKPGPVLNGLNVNMY
nr:hypothetical protein [Lachnospiraceae bacterium]